MPLLNRKSFSPTKPPPDLKPDEEVFVCRHTNEVFRDYRSFFERTILCSSMLWSCKYTGKSGLTYQEAQESERSIRKQGHSLPEPIQRAALTLVHHTQRGRLANLCDEVFSYLKDRYQEGEQVEVNYLSNKKRGIITRVYPPTEGSPNKTAKVGKLSSPKSRKHSQSGDKLQSPTSKNRNSPSDGTPVKERTNSSSSSDSQPLSAKKYCSDNVFARSPTGKSPRKSLDEESHSSKSKSRKRSVETSSEKTPSKSRKHSSDGKSTPSKSNSDTTTKKPSTPSSRKASDNKLVSPKSRSSSDGGAIESSKTNKSPSTSKNKSFEGEIVIIDDDDDGNQAKKSPQRPSPKLSSPKEKPVYNWPSASLYQYEIRIHSDKKDKGSKKKEKKHEVVIVQASLVSRKKGVFTRDKVKMFLKISCERSTPHSEDGIYIVQRAYRQKFDLGEPDIPLKLASPPKDKKRRKRSLAHGDQEGESGPVKKKRKKKKEDESKNEEVVKKKKDKKEKDGKSKDNKKMKLPPEEWRRIMEEEKERRKKQLEEERERKKQEREREKAENKAKREEERAVKKIERDKERERQREEKRLEAIRLKEWNKPREDLELDDLKDLPKTIPVTIKLPSELFGDMMMVLEFLNVFGNLFDIKDEFPSGLTFAMLEEALTEHDAEGVYYDLLLFLLGAILRTHLEEEEEEGLDGSHDHEPLMDVDDEGDEKSQSTVSASAQMAAAWPMQYQGKPLHELIMDPFTSSELLRLHLLSSGARIGCGEPSYRWQRRGGFTYGDDAGVEFRHAEPQLLKTLVTGNIYDMGAEDKLKVLVALCTQLITYATARDYVEEGFDQCRKVRREWQEDQWADQRKEKEEAAARYRRKQEERQRQKEELEKRKKEKDQEKIDGAKGESSAKAEDATKNGSEQNEGDQVKKAGKKTGKKKDENENSSQASEIKEFPSTTDSKVNGNKTAEDKDDEPNPVPVLTKEEEEELALQRKEDRKRKDQEFLHQLTKAVARSAIQPLGRDRVFRRYWAFRSLRGLFVEDDDPDQHLLLEPESDAESEDNEEGSGDEEKEGAEENENSTLHQNNSDNTKEEEKCLVNGHSKNKNPAKTENFERKVLNMFKAYQITKEACGDWCESYKKRPVIKWSYFASKDDIDQLLEALNSRGFREKPLKDAIQQDYKQLSVAVEKCPLKAEIQAQKKDTKPKGRRRNQPTVDKSRYKTMEEFLEANLRDQILDLEDRIWQGGLGSVRNVDREAWRAKVEKGIYGVFCKTETPASEECNTNGINEIKENGDPEHMEVDTNVEDENKSSVDEGKEIVVLKEEEIMDCDDQQQPVLNGVKDEQECHADSEKVAKVEDKPEEPPLTAVPSHLQLDSNPSSPAGDTRCSTPTLSLVGGPVAVNPAVKELALELLKVEQGIEKKYLNPPLGEDEETKRQKQKEAAAAAVSEFNEMMKAVDSKEKQKKDKRKKEIDAVEAGPKENGEKKGEEAEEDGQKDGSSSSSSSSGEPVKHKTCLERWEESVLVCTNLSQVFVHLNTLDQSIAWSKSVLNARCRLCKRKGDAEHMLLCDACDRGHHMYCLKPPIKEIPEGQWFCADCRPKETRRSERRKKPAAKEELEEESEEQSEEKEEESKEEDSDEDNETESESNSEEDDSEQSEGTVSSEHGDQCALCTEGGELLCCDTCPLAYHVSCAYPPLRRIPRGNWACQVCTGADDERPRSSRVKKATIEAAQKSLQRSIRVVKKKTTRSTSRPNSRQTNKAPSRSRKRQISSSPSPPPRARKTGAKTDKKTKRRRFSSSSRSPSSRSPSPAPRTSRKGGIKIAARGRSSIDSSRSSSPVLRSDSGKIPAGRKNPKLTAKLVLCQKLLNEMLKHEDAWPFLEPVDVTENPDYLEYVQRPVDLGTIKKNLAAKAYDSVEDFAADVRQVFINCAEYCRPRGKEARAGVRLSAFFETQYSDMGLDETETRTTRSRRM